MPQRFRGRLLMALLLTTGCGSSGDGDGDGGVGGGVRVGEPPAFSDDQAVLDYDRACLETCGPLSLSTVPVGWDLQLMQGSGCSLYTPAGWRMEQIPTGINVYGDDTGTLGYLIISTQLPGLDWSADRQVALVLDDLRKNSPDLEVLNTVDDDSLAGLNVLTRVVVFKATVNGVPVVSALRFLVMECSYITNSCPLLVMGSWTPLETLHETVCVLAQIDASLRCPNGGSSTCSDSTCDTDCRAEGYQGGACSGDDCQCR